MIWCVELAETIHDQNQNQNNNMRESIKTYLINMVAWSQFIADLIKLSKTKFAGALPEEDNKAGEWPKE